MKWFIFSCLLLLQSISLAAQYIDEYCVVESAGILVNKGPKVGAGIGIKVDYGDNRGHVDKILRDDQGVVIRFPSLIGGVNYLAKEGWRLFTILPSDSNYKDDFKYILVRQIPVEQHQMSDMPAGQ